MSLNSESCRELDVLSVGKYVNSISRRFARINGMEQEDMAQDIWVEVLQAKKRAKDIRLLITAAKQGAIHSVRHHKTEKRSAERGAYRVNEDGSDIQIECENSQGDPVFRVWLRGFLSKYPTVKAKSFVLYDGWGYSSPEVGEILGIGRDKARRYREEIMRDLKEALLETDA